MERITWDKVWKGAPSTGISMCQLLGGEYKVEVFRETTGLHFVWWK